MPLEIMREEETFMQKVQKQLRQDETYAKDDASPVTVADYGNFFYDS